MKIHAAMRENQPEIIEEAYEISEILELSESEYASLYQDLLEDQEYFAQRKSEDDAILILGENQNDGILVQTQNKGFAYKSSFIPEARLIEIKPWESSLLKAIEKAINTSDLGINPSNDGKVIRLVFPELTEERRKELTKDVKKKGEESKVAIRNIRRDAVDAFKKQEKKGEFSEDVLNDLLDEIQKITDKYIVEIDKKVESKSKDVLSV